MVSVSVKNRSKIKTTILIASDVASWLCAISLMALVLMSSVKENNTRNWENSVVRGKQLGLSHNRPCDEIYVVGEGETLHTISDKCGDPYIVERNPHIHDPDDVFPGLVIKIVPSNHNKSLR
ncbi:PREDICTED: uncharacterized protein LOC109217909 [Nicotiana attenuata]|uniref:LysM domain-containing protein n=1 Tax=Nicotiana attenuata TaxID=49451 RepID=A0A1J6KSV9_NICAT|nr:PREDICTED: uncharacterized protein LOC109217907 [Nicotiana attenuata]XP_019237753.1 PREDICTED: uncharacterized protein LOC109217909 [Nicotiana attenuata]OIT22201.1 hypothetical protein A4A49_38567 [Nicotiana attenuata]OIT22203.1 hypothetical protein A4A49_56163 [Nicotiana attenuata]